MKVFATATTLAIAHFNLAEIEFEEGEAKLVRTIGLGKGADTDHLGDPEGIARHPDTGEIYVTDEDNRQIVVYGTDGNLLGADGENHRIQVLTRDGVPIREFR